MVRGPFLCGNRAASAQAIVRLLIAGLVLVSIAGSYLAHAAAPPGNFPVPASPPAGTENLTVLRLEDSWAVIAYSTRPASGFADFEAYRLRDGKWARAFSERVQDAYGARLEIREDMRYRGRAIIVLRVQFGAAGEELRVYTLNGNAIERMQSLEASAFEWSYRPGSAPDLVAVPGSPGEPVARYRWNESAGRFIPTDPSR